MNLIKLAPFLILLILFSCTTEEDVTSKKVKEKEEPSAFDVTTNTLKAINDLDDKFKHAEELLKNMDSSNSILPLNNQIRDTVFYVGNVTFNDVVKPELIGEVQVYGNPKEVENFIEYLGMIKVGIKKYHIISKYSTIQLAISKRGRSSVLFLDENKTEVKSYNLEQPTNLPTSIQDNMLTFNVDGQEKSIVIESELPRMLCLPENLGCYE